MAFASPPGNDWIPLLDYAAKNGVSMSTLRRYIKSGKIEFRVLNGRYLVSSSAVVQSAYGAMPSGSAAAHPTPAHAAPPAPPQSPEQPSLVAQLRKELEKAHEEIAELKTLIALYEEIPPSHHHHPGAPANAG